jgi:hypothetical protein
MAKGAPKNQATPQKPGVAATAPAVTTAPKTTGSVNSVASAVGQKPAAGQKQTAAKPADPVGDICLLPDIARFAH